MAIILSAIDFITNTQIERLTQKYLNKKLQNNNFILMKQCQKLLQRFANIVCGVSCNWNKLKHMRIITDNPSRTVESVETTLVDLWGDF